MATVQITTGLDWVESVEYLTSLRDLRPSETTINFFEIQDIFDLVVDGINLTASISHDSIFLLCSELLEAMDNQFNGRHLKSIIEFSCEPWEMTLIGIDASILITVASVDRQQRVTVHDIEAPAEAFVRSLVDASNTILTELVKIDPTFTSDPFVRSFSRSISTLHARNTFTFPAQEIVDGEIGDVRLGTSGASGLSLDLVFDGDYHGLRGYVGEHMFDQHALLSPGRLVVETSNQSVTLSEYPILATKALVGRAHTLLSMLASEKTTFSLDDPICGFRFDITQPRDGTWELKTRPVSRGSQSIEIDIDPTECVETIITLGEIVSEKLVSLNPLLQANHRFEDFRNEVNELRIWWTELADTNIYHDDPEGFLSAHGGVVSEPIEERESSFAFPFKDVRAIYPRHLWSFHAERIHYSAVQATQTQLIVPHADNITVLDHQTGEEIWRETSDASRVLSSFARVRDVIAIASEDGVVTLHDETTGDTISRCPDVGPWLNDCVRYDGTIVISEHSGVICAVEIDTGETTWSYRVERGTTVGVAASGPSYIALSDNGAMLALNPVNGETLWRVRLSGIAEMGPWIHEGRAYAFSYDPVTHYVTLHALYPFTGRVVWQLRLDGRLAGAPTFDGARVMAPIERAGKTFLLSIPLEDPIPDVVWSLELQTAGLDTSTPVLISGELGVVRTDVSEFVCFKRASGEVVWRSEASKPELLYRNLPLHGVRDALVSIGSRVTVRSIETGEVWHEFGDQMVAAELFLTVGSLSVIYGERGAGSDPDQLTCFGLENFLALV